MKKILPISALVAAIVFASCGNDETKTDAKDSQEKKAADTVSTPPTEKTQSNTTSSVNTGPSAGKFDKNKILANIDQYLVSTPAYPDPGTVVIKNTLPNISIQKAIIEVTISDAKGVALRLDYYIVNNIEPGDSKTVKITGSASGVSASSHVVKLNSNELTGGETIIVGSKYTPK